MSPFRFDKLSPSHIAKHIRRYSSFTWLKARYHRATARVNHRPIFVIGNQKTGSTAIAALLAKATRKSVTLDVFYRIKSPVEKLLLEQKTTIRDIIRRNRFYFSTGIIKEPGFIFHYEQLHDFFPGAQFVFILRDPRDNIRSILNRLGLPGNFEELQTQHIESLPSYLWEIIIEGGLFATKGNNYIETQANRWNRALDIYEKNSKDITILRYEDFVKDKTGCITGLAKKLGLEPVCDISPYVDIQYQPQGDRSVSWLEFFGPDNLRRIEDICADGMKRFGYPPPINGGS